MNDRALVREVVERDDREAFAELVRRHRDKAFGLAISTLGPGAEAAAEDVVQEAFLRAYRRLPGFRGEARFTTWLYRIVRNLAIDRLRRPRQSRPHVDEAVLSRRAAVEGDPQRALLVAERARRIEACLRRLPRKWQACFRLHYWMDCSTREIGEMLDMPRGTVKSYLFRGRELLAACLEEDADGD